MEAQHKMPAHITNEQNHFAQILAQTFILIWIRFGNHVDQHHLRRRQPPSAAIFKCSK